MVHPWGFVNSRWDPNGAPLVFGELAIIANDPWGFVNSLWDSNGAPLGFCEYAVGPPWGFRNSLWDLVHP